MHNQSDPESDEENDEGDYTVYECPGLASVSSAFIGNHNKKAKCYDFTDWRNGSEESNVLG